VSATVVVCTRGRPEPLRRCLASVSAQLGLTELIVVENGRPDPATVSIVAAAGGRHLLEPRVGSSAARNRGLYSARGEVVAFLDDDCRAEEGWLEALLAPFADATVHAVTGQVVPEALTSPSQQLFDRLFPYSKGPLRRCLGPGPAAYPFPLNANEFGTGASMAFRRPTLLALGGFVEALSAGGPARGGEDAHALFAVLHAGHRLVYEPAARVRHPHPSTPAELNRVFFDYGVAHLAYLTHCLLVDGERRALRRALATIAHYAIRAAVGRRADLPRQYLLRHLVGSCLGPVLYLAARVRYG
jgi:O-antigen biosynthesis protein